MSHHHRPPHVTRVFIACSPTYHNRRAVMEALGSIFLDTIDEQREYYYFECPAITEIFDDGALNRANFHQLVPATDPKTVFAELRFSHIVAGGDDAFVERLLADIGVSDALLVRLA